jgi:PAS domain S-box-containing protein
MSARGSDASQKRAGGAEPSPSVVPARHGLAAGAGAAADKAAAAGAGAGAGAGAAKPAGPGAHDLDLLETILTLTPARIAYYDRDGGLRFMSPAFAQVLGVSPEQEMGRSPEAFGISKARRERMAAHLATVRQTGRPLHEVVTLSHDGATYDTEVAVEPDLAPDGTVRGVVVTAWDVTELRRATRRIAHLDRVHSILSDINQAIVRIRDRDQLLSEACRIAAEVGGFEVCWIGLVEPNGDITIAASAGRDLAVLDEIVVSARDEPSGRGAVGTAIRENRPVVVTDALTDERMAPWRALLTGRGFRTAAALPLHQGGRPVGAFALYSTQPGYFDEEEIGLFEELADDISFALDSLEAERDKTAAEVALRESERRYRDLFELNPQPMWVYDIETLRFLAINDAAVHHYGWSREEFLALTLADIRPPEDVPAMLASVRDVSGPFRPRGLWRHLRKDGTLMDMEITGHDADFDGRKARLISAIDVTERRRLEAQLAEATRIEAMGHLAGGIAHDFNNLLTAVNGYADLLVAELGDSPLAEDAREIRRAGGRAAELTQQVLAFARRQVLVPRPVDLNEVLGGVSQMLRRLIGEETRLVTTVDSRPAVVMADPGQLEQVLVNLAVNAHDAMPEGGVLEISVRRVEEAASLGHGAITGPAALVTVTDTGVGMDEGTLARAFEPFFTTKRAGAGTGLGLAMVYGIVHQSNGEIWADSVVGRGTTISVLLSCVEASPKTVAETLPVASNAAETATLLVVEDEPVVRALVVSILERSGYRVLVAGSAAEAVALAEGLDEPIDLLLTDLMMPVTNGQVLAEQLLKVRPALRVVLMSGYGAGLGPMPADGKFRFIAKPFGREELTALVAKVLSES